MEPNQNRLLSESLLVLLNENIFLVLLFPFWALQGKAYLKQEVARRITLASRRFLTTNTS
jgi:hypothetical protein